MGCFGVKKVLVVIMDKNFGVFLKILVIVVRDLEDKGVLVIFVGVGEDVEWSELNVILFNFMDVIFVWLNVNLIVLVERIMDRILKCKIEFWYLLFYFKIVVF